MTPRASASPCPVPLPASLVVKNGSNSLLRKASGIWDAGPGILDRDLHVTGKLLSAIPRLEDVAAIVTAQFEPIHWRGVADDIGAWNVREAGRLLLRTAFDFEQLITRGATREAAVETLRTSKMVPLRLAASLVVHAEQQIDEYIERRQRRRGAIAGLESTSRGKLLYKRVRSGSQRGASKDRGCAAHAMSKKVQFLDSGLRALLRLDHCGSQGDQAPAVFS